jgi:hypothetical protein
MNPETTREQQQERMREAVDHKNQEARARSEEESLIGHDRQQDQLSVRAKSSGHARRACT